MTTKPLRILTVGATDSICRFVVTEALRQCHVVRSLVRDSNRADH
jgi:hypothetical protein